MNDRTLCVSCALLPLVFASTALAAEDPRDDGGVGSERRDGDGTPSPEHFRIGVLGGVGFPRPLAIEGLVKVERLIGVGVEYSALPSMTISGVGTSFWALAGDVRVFPFRSAFFVGLRAGYQHLGVATTVTLTNIGSAAIAAQVNTAFINPRLGFLWTWEPGITLGIDAGLQIPLGSEVSTEMPALATGTVVDQELMNVASAVGQTMLPTLDLLRIGFLL